MANPFGAARRPESQRGFRASGPPCWGPEAAYSEGQWVEAPLTMR